MGFASCGPAAKTTAARQRCLSLHSNQARDGNFVRPCAFPALAFADPRQPAAHDGMMLFSGTTSVIREDFPQLLDAVTLDAWPTFLVNDEKCEVPPTVGEDYSGVKCSGTEIAAVSNSEVPTGVGEGYYGFQPAVTPDHNYATITLNLKLTQTSATPSVDSKSESAGQ
jgi:hypothetical protein